jgi:thiosulfate dehydrogenase
MPAPDRPVSLSIKWIAGLIAGTLLVLILVAAFAFNAGLQYPRDDPGANGTSIDRQAALLAFAPPPESAIPAGPDGDAIRRGEQIFLNTRAHAGQFVGDGLSCGNCHLDGGRTANAAPMWAAWVRYPMYRAKNKAINTMTDRIQACFKYSMNAQGSPSGGPPPLDSDVYRDLERYFAWLATGAPTGAQMPGAGYLKLAATSMGHDPKRGALVFADKCASCHGADGQGQKNPDGSYAYPPLWGPASFNWGAGMATVANAAGFIRANMPYGQGGSLSDQQAWDAAAFVDSHDRPRDPRQTGSIAAAQAAFHQKGDYYGQTVDGDLLGDGIAKAG